MRRILILYLIWGLILGCQGETGQKPVSESSVIEINAGEFPVRSTINPRAMAILKDWTAFQELETSLDALYRVENNEDLILAVEEIVNKQNELEASKYPEAFDIPQVKSRQKVFKTYLLKLKAASEYRTEVIPPAKEMLDAYNAFREQFNLVVNNTLDLDKLLDE